MAMLLRRHRAKRDKRQTTSAPEAAALTPAEVDALKGKSLADALEAAGLPKTGTADEKRAALTAHYAAPQDADELDADEADEPQGDTDTDTDADPEADEPEDTDADEPADADPADEPDES